MLLKNFCKVEHKTKARILPQESKIGWITTITSIFLTTITTVTFLTFTVNKNKGLIKANVCCPQSVELKKLGT